LGGGDRVTVRTLLQRRTLLHTLRGKARKKKKKKKKKQKKKKSLGYGRGGKDRGNVKITTYNHRQPRSCFATKTKWGERGATRTSVLASGVTESRGRQTRRFDAEGGTQKLKGRVGNCLRNGEESAARRKQKKHQISRIKWGGGAGIPACPASSREPNCVGHCGKRGSKPGPESGSLIYYIGNWKSSEEQE